MTEMRAVETNVIRGEVVRFVINGVAATLTHLIVMIVVSAALGEGYAGVSNAIGVGVAIFVSFLGSRYFVFPHRRGDWRQEVARFSALYGTMLLVQFAVLFVWTDIWGLNKYIGFCIGVGLHASVTFFGNRYLVFRNGV